MNDSDPMDVLEAGFPVPWDVLLGLCFPNDSMVSRGITDINLWEFPSMGDPARWFIDSKIL